MKVKVIKSVNNRAFSLVELIIVIAVMAVLVGVMAPQYMKYLEKTKKTSDCAAISVILDACEVIALDPNTEWNSSDPIEIKITTAGATYTGGAATTLNEFVPGSSVVLESADWGDIEIEAIKSVDGRVTFDISDVDQKTEINRYSTAIAERLE